MELDIFHDGVIVGNAQIADDGLYWRIEASCTITDCKVHRLWAHTQNGSVRLGVLIPNGECLLLSRKIPKSALHIAEESIISTRESMLPTFSGTVGTAAVRGAYLLETDGKRTLCILYRDEPFVLMEYICFFRLEQIDGRLYWMAELDDGNFPVFC